MNRCRQGRGRGRVAQANQRIRHEHGGQCCAAEAHDSATPYSALPGCIPLMHGPPLREKSNPGTVPPNGGAHSSTTRCCAFANLFTFSFSAAALSACRSAASAAAHRKDATRDIPCNTQRARRCDAVTTRAGPRLLGDERFLRVGVVRAVRIAERHLLRLGHLPGPDQTDPRVSARAVLVRFAAAAVGVVGVV